MRRAGRRGRDRERQVVARMWRTGTLVHVSLKHKMVQFLKNLNIKFCPRGTPKRIEQKYLNTYYTYMFIATLIVIAKRSKYLPKCLSIDKWINKL